MNLTGFCAGDPEECGAQAAMNSGMMLSAVPPTPFNAAIENALYRVAAAVGSRACACLPELAPAIVGILGLPEEIAIPVVGSIASAALGVLIGSKLKSQMCPNSSCL